jgi:4-carboxymuconolactone decarboxylase
MTIPSARTEETAIVNRSKPLLTYKDVRKVAPALFAYPENRMHGTYGSVPASRRATVV